MSKSPGHLPVWTTYNKRGRDGRLERICELVRILADTRLARPDCPDCLAETLLPPVPGGRAMRCRAVPSRALVFPGLPAIGAMRVVVVLLLATRARSSRCEAKGFLLVCRQQIRVKGGELEGLLGARIG